MSKNRICQTMPKHWRNLAEFNAVALSKLFGDAKVELILNADKAFVYFYLE